MITEKKPNPPLEVIPEDSGPPLTDIKEPKKNPEGEGLDIDDAQIEEPKDDAFKKAPKKEQPLKKRKGMVALDSTLLPAPLQVYRPASV